MALESVTDEYARALRLGQKEYRELLMAGKNPHPEVLDELLPEMGAADRRLLGERFCARCNQAPRETLHIQ